MAALLRLRDRESSKAQLSLSEGGESDASHSFHVGSVAYGGFWFGRRRDDRRFSAFTGRRIVRLFGTGLWWLLNFIQQLRVLPGKLRRVYDYRLRPQLYTFVVVSDLGQ